MLQSLQSFWMSTPPDPAIPFTLWRGFGQEVLGWMSGSSLFFIALTVVLYWAWCRKIVIRTPFDPFAQFTPMRWLFLSFAAGTTSGIAYAVRFHSVFPTTLISPIGGAMTMFFLATLVTYLAAQLVIWVPGITPRKLIYHPRWLWRLMRRNLRQS